MIVQFNVGGSIFATTTQTLERYGDNMLTRMLSSAIPTQKIGEAYFIDRDGALFAHVLSVLRDTFDPSSYEEAEIERIQSELDFYAINVQLERPEKRRAERNEVEIARLMASRYKTPSIHMEGNGQVIAIASRDDLHLLFDPHDHVFGEFPAFFESHSSFKRLVSQANCATSSSCPRIHVIHVGAYTLYSI